MNDDDLQLLQRACAERLEVTIEVTDCLYGCCSRPPSRRAGYLQVYHGFVADLNDRRLVLHAIAVSSLNYHVIAELANIIGVTVTPGP